jgi:hypothetical protein
MAEASMPMKLSRSPRTFPFDVNLGSLFIKHPQLGFARESALSLSGHP